MFLTLAFDARAKSDSVVNQKGLIPVDFLLTGTDKEIRKDLITLNKTHTLRSFQFCTYNYNQLTSCFEPGNEASFLIDVSNGTVSGIKQGATSFEIRMLTNTEKVFANRFVKYLDKRISKKKK